MAVGPGLQLAVHIRRHVLEREVRHGTNITPEWLWTDRRG
jgi:hypothetical protein